MRKVLVISLDADGCLFNKYYHKSEETETDRVIQANRVLIDYIVSHVNRAQYQKIIIMVGSNRQSIHLDKKNCRHNLTESCFDAIKMISHALQQALPDVACHVDGYLLADSYGRVPPGENFARFSARDHAYTYSHTIFDQTKLTLLYAQMHKVASEHCDAQIQYFFIDDHYHPFNDVAYERDILNGLGNFFSDHPDILPANVHVNLFQYMGDTVSLCKRVEGAGIIDNHFAFNLYRLLTFVNTNTLFSRHYAAVDVLKALLTNSNHVMVFKQHRHQVPNEAELIDALRFHLKEDFYCCVAREFLSQYSDEETLDESETSPQVSLSSACESLLVPVATSALMMVGLFAINMLQKQEDPLSLVRKWMP